MEGNQMKIREALRALRDASRGFYNQILNSKYSGILDKYTCVKQGFPAVLDLMSAFQMANAALSAPPRQCDVGTPEEQRRRFNMFCKRTGDRFGESAYCVFSCPCGEVDCKLEWAQMPYAEQEGGAE